MVRAEKLNEPRSPSITYLLEGIVNFQDALIPGTTDRDLFISNGDIFSQILDDAKRQLEELVEYGVRVKGGHKSLQYEIINAQVNFEDNVHELIEWLRDSVVANHEEGVELFPVELKEEFLSGLLDRLNAFELSFKNLESRIADKIFKDEGTRMNGRQLKSAQRGIAEYDEVLPLVKEYGQRFQDIIDALDLDLRAQKVMQGIPVELDDDGDPAYEIPDFVNGVGSSVDGVKTPNRPNSHLRLVITEPEQQIDRPSTPPTSR